MAEVATIGKGAVISDCGKYRYLLWRTWDETKPVAVFIMLNPSTADGLKDDATIRKCCAFARLWGCGGIVVVNVFGWRATDPCALPADHVAYAEPANPGRNLQHINAVMRGERLAGGVATFNVYAVIAAWGASKRIGQNADLIVRLAKEDGVSLQCFGKTKAGAPKHPVYLPYSTPLEAFP